MAVEWVQVQEGLCPDMLRVEEHTEAIVPMESIKLRCPKVVVGATGRAHQGVHMGCMAVEVLGTIHMVQVGMVDGVEAGMGATQGGIHLQMVGKVLFIVSQNPVYHRTTSRYAT